MKTSAAIAMLMLISPVALAKSAGDPWEGVLPENYKLTDEVMGAEADNYRSTEDLKAPVEYMGRSKLFSKREYAPASEQPGECREGHG